MSDRYGPSSSRRHPRKTSRYESSSDDGQSAVCSEKDGGSDSGRSCVPASTTSSRRRSSSRSHNHHHSHGHSHHRGDHHRDQPRSSPRSSHHSHHRHHQRSRRHSHHHGKKLLGPAATAEDPEKKPRDGSSMALAVRDDEEYYQVQTVPRAAHPASVSDDGEEVYDHRPKPLSHRSRSSHVGGARGAGAQGRQQASDADKGFFMAAAALAVSLIICCGEVDND
ncbi:hypothetical protein Daus18300_008986 [Diaporthe australafricana]|uniref:Uncharacterized protein n=1 Tax=Diaporthe australafricana TaxID=127596 RepID=A0ABR3WG20_9PEZI